jgi:polygalacturonase
LSTKPAGDSIATLRGVSLLDRRRFLASAAAGAASASFFGNELVAGITASAPELSAQLVYNVKEYGATGNKQDDARPALQQAIDTCGQFGGGTVYVPPGEYTSGQLHLRSVGKGTREVRLLQTDSTISADCLSSRPREHRPRS